MDENGLLMLGLGLLAASLLLVIAEVFLPSGGLIAIAAGAVAIIGLVNLFRADTTWGLIGVLIVMVLAPMAFAFGLRIWPHTPLGRRMLMGDSGEEELASRQRVELEARERRLALVGAEGVAVTPLRPVGVVRIGDERYDALAETSIIENGERIRVTAVYDNQIKVRPA